MHRKRMPSTKLRQRLYWWLQISMGSHSYPSFPSWIPFFTESFLQRDDMKHWTCSIMSVHTVNKIVLSSRTAKADARTAIGAHAAEMETTPFRQNSNPNRKPFFQSFLDSCRSLIKQRFSLLTMLWWTRLLENSSHVTATTITACLVGKKQSSPATVLHHAYKYSVSKLHSPYGKLSTRQIQER